VGKKQLSSKKQNATTQRHAQRDLHRESESNRQAESHGTNHSPADTSLVESSPLVAMAIGAGMTVTLLMPTDSVSGALGDGLPLVAYWLMVPFLFTWLVGRQFLASDASGQVMLQRSTVIVGYAWAPVLIWATTVVLVHWGQGNERWSINSLWQYFGAAFCTLSLTTFATTASRRRDLLRLFLLLSVGLAIHGLYQYFVSMPADRRAFELDPIGSMRQAGIDTTIGSQAYQQFRNRVHSTEPFATFALANSLAVVLGVATVLGFGMAIGEWLKCRRWRALLPWLTVALLVGVVLILTKSRAAWIGTAVGIAGLILTLIWSRRELRKPMVLVAALGVVGVLVLGWIGYRQDRLVFLEATKSFQYRIEYWIATGEMISDHLLAGVGLGQFQHHYTWYKLAQASETVADPHNWVMEILATTGIGGALAWFMFAGVIWRWRRKIMSTPINGGLSLQEDSPALPVAKSAPWTWANQPDSSPRKWLFVGAFLGLPLSIMLGLPLGQLPDFVPLFWATSGVTALGIWLFINDTRVAGESDPTAGTSESQPLVYAIQSGILFWAAMVWGISLLAAGGWMVPGVCLVIWLFVAIGLGALSEKIGPVGICGWPVKRLYWLLLQMGKIVIFATFLGAAWNPVMNLLPVLNSLNSSRRIDVQTLQKATEIDPLDPRPWQYLARYQVEESLASSANSQEKALTSIEKWLSCNPASAAMQRNAGDWAWLMATAKNSAGQGDLAGQGEIDAEMLRVALRYYRQAEERFPNDAGYVLQLAAIHEAVGDHETAVGLAERANQLDQSHSHLDRKLEIQSIWWPGFNPTASTMNSRSTDPHLVPATEVLHRILPSSR
jgi:O-antigen ligase